LAYPDGRIIGRIKSINTMLVYWRSISLRSLQSIGVAAPSTHAGFRSTPTKTLARSTTCWLGHSLHPQMCWSRHGHGSGGADHKPPRKLSNIHWAGEFHYPRRYGAVISSAL